MHPKFFIRFQGVEGSHQSQCFSLLGYTAVTIPGNAACHCFIAFKSFH
jgi:hypothetical protein